MKTRLILINLFLAGILAMVLAYSYAGTTNTLLRNGNWNSTKPYLAIGVMGAVGYFVTPIALDDGMLNLGAWHGYQEVYYNEEVRPTSLSFDVKTSGAFNILFINDSGSFGLYLSPEKKGFIFFADNDGRFIYNNSLAIMISGGEWHHISIDIGKYISFYLDGEKMIIPIELSSKYRIGFRGENRDTLIDNVIINSSDSTFREDFSEFSYAWTVLLFLILSSVVIVLRKYPKQIFMIFLTVTIMISIYSLYYFQYASARYPMNAYYMNKIDQPDITRIFSGNLTCPESGGIMLLGGSQAWGAGASTMNLSIEGRIESHYRKGDILLDLSYPGAKSYGELQLYGIYNKCNESILIIDMSNNDMPSSGGIEPSGKENFRSNLIQIISYAKDRGVIPILVLEPANLNSQELAENHDIMVRLGEEYNISLIDMHKEMIAHEGTGFIWWDSIHLTDYGQKLFAEKVIEELERMGYEP